MINITSISTTHGELTGIVCAYIIEQSIINNVIIDYNDVINKLDDFLADYADQYGFVELKNNDIQDELIAFMENKLLLNYKIDTNKVISKVAVFFNSFETEF